MTAPASSPRPALHVSLWIVQVLLAVTFAGTGAWKLLTPVPALAAKIPWAGEVPRALLVATAVADLLGGLGVVVPSLTRVRPRLAALAAIVIPFLVRRFGLRASHLINVTLGGLGLISIPFMPDAQWLLLSMVGVGFAWASILSMPYALLSDSVPAQKMGVYMGIFNFFIVIPQLVAVATLGYLLHAVFGNHPANLLILGGASMILSGLLVLRVPEPAGHATPTPA